MTHPSSIRQIGISSSVVALFFTSVTFSTPSFRTPGNTLQNVAQQSVQLPAQDPAQGLVRQAQDLIRTRQFNEAVEVLRRAIQTQPNLAVAHIQLSIALMGIGQRDEAFSEAKRAIELDPNDAHDWVAKPGTFIYEPAGESHTLVITEDSPEPALILFIVEGGLIYLDKAIDGGFAAYEDGFTLLELTRKYYREAGLDVRQLDQLIR